MNSTEAELQKNYEIVCNKQNDLTPYAEILHYMSKHVSSVTEMGIGPLHYGLNSTWALLSGLHLSSGNNKKYVAYDYQDNPVNHYIYTAKSIAESLKINFDFIIGDTGEVVIESSDLLFIDTDHTYQHLMKELTLHSPKINKYILIHDTSGKYGHWEDWPYDHERRGELQTQPEKYGLWPCCKDFLKDNKEWKLLTRYEENNGLTILERI
jgi:hypothetical protein